MLCFFAFSVLEIAMSGTDLEMPGHGLWLYEGRNLDFDVRVLWFGLSLFNRGDAIADRKY